MAIPSDRRTQEAGVSLVEALVTVALTALIAIAVLGIGSRATGRGHAISEDSLDAEDRARAELEVRGLLAGVVQAAPREAGPALSGQDRLVVVRSARSSSGPCASEGVVEVSLAVDSGALWCEAAGRRRALMRWREGDARFAFSKDGRRWTSSWQEPIPIPGVSAGERVAPLVRFELRTSRGVEVSWVVRAGSMEPERVRVAADANP